MRVALPLLGLLAVAAPATQPAAAGLAVEAVPAWQGWSRPGRTTELEVRVAGQGDAVVTVASDGQRIVASTQVAADRPARLRVPLAAAQSVTISATVGTGTPTQAQATLSLSESPLLAWVSTRDEPPPSVAGFRTLTLAPAALPGNVAAYSSIDALVISAGTLAALDQEQMIALLDHVASCGRTVLVGAAADTAALFASGAGCGGRTLGAVPDSGDAAAEVERLLQQSPREMPRAGSLATLSGADVTTWHVVVTTLAGCAALLLLAAAFSSSVLLQVALAGTLASAAAWFVQSRPSATQLVVWAEAGPGERLAQYRAMQRATLQRRDAAVVDLYAELAAPTPCRELDAANWHWDAQQRRYTHITLPGRLFDSISLCYSGSFPIARAAAWQAIDGGRVVLRNSGPADWPPGTLLWRGTVQPLPGIAPGTDFVPATETGKDDATAAEQLASSRTSRDDTALLWPLDLRIVTSAPASSQAWLLLAAGPIPAGTMP